MTTGRFFAVAACGLLAACGEGALLQDAAARFRLVAQISTAADDEAVRVALRKQWKDRAPSLVFATDDAATRALSLGGAPDTVGTVVAIGTPGGETPGQRPPDSLVVDETGAATAVDIALLCCSGIEVPKQLPLGTRVISRTHATAGGTPRPAPGDFIVEMLRREHADVLAVPPKTDAVFRIGFVQFRADDPWHTRVRDEVVAAARHFRQLELASRSADGEVTRQDEILRAFLAEGRRAILVSTDDPASLATIAAEAREHKVALIVLDRLLRDEHATVCIGADQQVLGRAAGEAAARLLSNGGTIVELHGDLRSPLQQRRHQGFVDALGLK